MADSRQRPLPLVPAQDRTHFNLDRSTLEPEHEETWAESLHRRYSEPPAYTALRTSTDLSLSRSPSYASRLPGGFVPPSPSSAGPLTPVLSEMHPELTCEHQHILKSLGKDWAALFVRSRASAAHPRPLLYSGDDVSGRVSIALGKLGQIQRVEVVLQEFVHGRITPAAETRKVLLPSDVDASLVRAGLVEWGFALTPALNGSSPLLMALPAEQRVQDGRRTCLLLVTVYRRGMLNQNPALRLPIEYLGPSSSTATIDNIPASVSVHDTPPQSQHRDWAPQPDFPELRIRGHLFSDRGAGNTDISVRLAVPKRYPSCAPIPLRAVLSCADRRALDLLHSNPNGLDVQMIKIVAHGDAAARIGPLSLGHRSEFFRRVPVARGQFRASDIIYGEDDSTLWRLDIEGELVALPDAGEVGPTLRFPDLVVMYTIVLFPFKVAGFKPISAPNKQLFIAEIPLLPVRGVS
ncbi:unnamed protein product [Peniophora sp. CBMAI 1063]|nr:unnamed protein product [Peniophora sp. CBMAI 1063]